MVLECGAQRIEWRTPGRDLVLTEYADPLEASNDAFFLLIVCKFGLARDGPR